jgi:hypothetical protein
MADPAPAASDMAARKHFADGIIPLLSCKTPPIFLTRGAFSDCRDAIPIEGVEKLLGKRS